MERQVKCRPAFRFTVEEIVREYCEEFKVDYDYFVRTRGIPRRVLRKRANKRRLRRLFKLFNHKAKQWRETGLFNKS